MSCFNQAFSEGLNRQFVETEVELQLPRHLIETKTFVSANWKQIELKLNMAVTAADGNSPGRGRQDRRAGHK